MKGDGAPIVALVGRQNVGKSTLANRLVGRREAIADEMPGVTRDRVELEAAWRGRTFRLVDTGGYRRRARGIEATVVRQAQLAADAADLILLVVDGQTGPVEEDVAIARRLRAAGAPVMVVVNKIDAEREEADAWAFERLGLGEPVAVSGLHGRGAGELLDRIVTLLPEPGTCPRERSEPRFAVVGRPNVGKSSLFNLLVGEERSVVHEQSGTTRDAVDALVAWPSGPVRFVDTAGFRRSSKAHGVEYHSLLRTIRAIERAHVALLVLDATEGFTTEDRKIAARVIEHGRGLCLAANKWDLVAERDRSFKQIQQVAGPFALAAVVRTSAMTGAGVARLPADLLSLHRRWSARVPTAEVNRMLGEAQADRPAPSGMRYRYGTQVGVGPPTFVLFGGTAPDASYQRFLEHRLRGAFAFDGVPLRLRFRARKRGPRS